MLFWGLTLSFVGKALLAIAVIAVHKKITEEKRIDGVVLMEMRHERTVAFAGLIFMTLGYVLELIHFGVFYNLLEYVPY